MNPCEAGAGRADTVPPVAKNYRGTVIRSIRIPDDVWQAAIERAQRDGSSVSAEVVAFLRAYGNGERYTLRATRSET